MWQLYDFFRAKVIGYLRFLSLNSGHDVRFKADGIIKQMKYSHLTKNSAFYFMQIKLCGLFFQEGIQSMLSKF
jgi:hypothetical protein